MDTPSGQDEKIKPSSRAACASAISVVSAAESLFRGSTHGISFFAAFWSPICAMSVISSSVDAG